ncbi:MAG: T9SS type A sorting domain-containing protein, partial [Bacteroidales bacterium]|nr:T9SS type A sorting domain-containing protein [Bacteroidales bacterium]
DAVEGATKYNVYQFEELLGSISNTEVDIYDLADNTEYCFTVTAIIEGVESEPSNEACETTLPGEGIVELTSAINVYPNPVNDRLYIETETVVEEVVVYDVFGRHQVTETPSHQGDLSIDVADLNSGVYFVKVVTENGEAVQRFVKK